MLATRLMPCLLMSNGALVKTVRFKDGAYVGDPVNAVRIFNQKEVDELILLDIHATTQKRGIDFETLEKLTSECFMPICYGGGVRTLEEMRRLLLWASRRSLLALLPLRSRISFVRPPVNLAPRRSSSPLMCARSSWGERRSVSAMVNGI